MVTDCNTRGLQKLQSGVDQATDTVNLAMIKIKMMSLVLSWVFMLNTLALSRMKVKLNTIV